MALWVVPVADVGGVRRHVIDVARAGIPGWRLVVACPEGPLATELRDLEVPVLTGPLSPADSPGAGVRWLRQQIRCLRPRLVHSHLAYADMLTVAATIGFECKVVSTEHGIADDDLIYHGTKWKSRLRAWVHHVRLRKVDALIGVCESTVHIVRRKWHPPPRLHVTTILNGADPLPDKFAGSGLRVASLARLAPEKGLTDLIAAFALVADLYPEARLTLAGDGPLQQELRRHVQNLGLDQRVTFVGVVDPSTILPRTDVLVQLSVWENCSYSILDALAHGVGVVATAVGGNPELLPSRCLVDRSSHEAVARAIVTQGINLGDRPALPEGWPTVVEMTKALASLYDGLTTATLHRHLPGRTYR